MMCTHLVAASIVLLILQQLCILIILVTRMAPTTTPAQQGRTVLGTRAGEALPRAPSSRVRLIALCVASQWGVPPPPASGTPKERNSVAA
jgi:hypothetical protein